MPRTYTTITDLAQELAEGLDLDVGEVTEAIRQHHHLFGGYGKIPLAELFALSAAVFTSVTGLDYPEAWAQQDRDYLAAEADEECAD